MHQLQRTFPSLWPKFALACALLSLLCSATAMARGPDCTHPAAAYHGVNPWVLAAILWKESAWQPAAVRGNTNGTTDYGIAQINSIHLRELGRYGLGHHDLMNPCVGTYVAAWHLRRQMNLYGNTWFAIGAYHSVTPGLNMRYAADVCRIVRHWQVALQDKPPAPSVGQGLPGKLTC